MTQYPDIAELIERHEAASLTFARDLLASSETARADKTLKADERKEALEHAWAIYQREQDRLAAEVSQAIAAARADIAPRILKANRGGAERLRRLTADLSPGLVQLLPFLLAGMAPQDVVEKWYPTLAGDDNLCYAVAVVAAANLAPPWRYHFAAEVTRLGTAPDLAALHEQSAALDALEKRAANIDPVAHEARTQQLKGPGAPNMALYRIAPSLLQAAA